MFKQFIRLCLVIITLIASSAWAQTAAIHAQKQTPEKVRLQLKWFNQFQFAGYYAAIEKGYYTQEGLDVEIKERVLDKNFVKQVTSGDAEYGVGDSGLLTQYAQGAPIAALAAIFQHNPLVFFSRQDSGIISPHEMKSKRVMSDIVSTNEASLSAMLSGTGISDKDYILVPQENNYALLVDRKIDVISGYITNEPFFFKEKGLKVNIINPKNYGIDFYGDILFTSQKELQEHPGRADRFRRASLKGWRYALDHPEELIQLISKKYHSKLSVEHLRFEAVETRKLILPDVVPIGTIEPARMKLVGDTYASSGFNRSLTQAELTAFIYTGKATVLKLTDNEKAWLAKHPVIRVGIDYDFAPYEWVDKHGQYVGMAADYMRLLEKELGVRFEFIKDKAWAEVLSMAKRGELDMLSFAVKTDDRSQYLNFSEQFKAAPVVIIDNGQGNFIGSLDQLAGKRVAIEKGYFLQELLQRDHQNIQLMLTSNTREALNLVFDGKADAYVGDAGSVNYAIKNEGLLSLRFSGQTNYQSQHSVAVTKNNPELSSIINKALATLSEDKVDAIYNRWLGLNIEEGVRPETLIKYGVAFVLLMVLFGYWVYRMNREILIRKATSDENKNLAFYDPLTQLPNRRLLFDRLNQAIASSARSGKQGALLFLDLDHFKTLNDTLGHDIGDLLLQQVASRLTSCVREGDTVARLGGDEFVVLLEDLSKNTIEAASQTQDVAEKIIFTLNQPYQLNSYSHHSTPSIGATLFEGHTLGLDELLKQADIAMYQSKSEGRNTLRFFDPIMQESISARADLEHELRKAIEWQQFQLHYQIQVDSNGQALGAEALIRWQHPERGMISPCNFIPLAEDTGLILPIGQWVLDTACAQLKVWQQSPLTQDLVLAVNVSAKQFFQKDFVEQVQTTIYHQDINPTRLKLELTESMLVENIDDIITKMEMLSKMGVRFSLDDFGTGYSSLRYLKNLPLNQLKVDQSFVRDLISDSSDRAIVRTIITMAHSLGINVIAEGVETAEQRQYLLDSGCRQYQGYLFSKPLPIDAFEALLGEDGFELNVA